MPSDSRRQPTSPTSPDSALPPVMPARTPTLRDALNRAEHLRQSGKPGGALALCRAVLLQVPDSVDALNLAGVAAHNAGDDAAALGYLRRAAESAPDRADIHRNLGILLLAMGHPDEAATALGQAATHAPAEASLRVDLATALAGAGRQAEAIDVLQAALRADPHLLPAIVYLGRLLRRAGRPAEAAQAFAQAVALNPTDAAVAFEHAESLGESGQTVAAVAAYRKVLALRPDDAEAHNNLGTLLAGSDQLDAAATALRAAAALRPDDGRILLNLGNVLRYAGDRTAARDILRRAIAVAPQHAAALSALGAVLADLGDADAEATLRQALALDPDRLEAHYALAGWLQRAGRPEAARQAYAEVLRLDPDNATARHLAAALGGDNPDQPPAGFVRDLFDGYAQRFERHLVAELGYSMPATLHRMVAGLLTAAATPSPPFRRVCDLGCGTGLAGVAFRPLSEFLEGVDLSPRMLAAAEAKGIYDALHVADAETHLRDRATEPPDDLLIAADMMNYVGDLAPLFAAAARRLRTGGLFAFSVERLEDDGFRLCPSGRYVHGESYVRRLAAAHGFAVAAFEEADIRREAGVPERGMAWVLRREDDRRP